MNNKSKNIFSCLAKMLVVLLYLSFLTVQLSFNFDTQGNSNSNNTLFSNFSKSNASNHLSVVKNRCNNKGIKANIRLNKRFQPEKAICCSNITIKAPVCHVTTARFSHYNNFEPTLFLYAQSLRGPPSVA